MPNLRSHFETASVQRIWDLNLLWFFIVIVLDENRRKEEKKKLEKRKQPLRQAHPAPRFG